MKVTYKAVTLQEAFELIKENQRRDDLYFEHNNKENPQQLCNLANYKLEATDFINKLWFKREIEDVKEGD